MKENFHHSKDKADFGLCVSEKQLKENKTDYGDLTVKLGNQSVYLSQHLQKRLTEAQPPFLVRMVSEQISYRFTHHYTWSLPEGRIPRSILFHVASSSLR